MVFPNQNKSPEQIHKDADRRNDDTMLGCDDNIGEILWVVNVK